MKNQYQNTYRVLLIVLLIVAVSIQGGRKFDFFSKEKKAKHTVTLEYIKQLFPSASSFHEREDKGYNVLASANDTLGYVVPSFLFASKVKGFAGEVPELIAFNDQDIIQGMVLMKHHESAEYMEYIVDEKLLERWNNKTIQEAIDTDVDAITAATETSEAIIHGVNLTLSGFSGLAQKEETIKWQEIVQIILTLLTITFALLVCFVRKLKKYRVHMLVAVAVVMGVMYQTMMSMSLLHGWAINGLPWYTNTLVVIVLLLSLILPFTTKKQFYCHYMCPYGAVQELAGKASPFKKRPMNWLTWKGVHLQTVLFVLLLIGLLTGYYPELSMIEPFPAFSVKVVSWGMIGFGAFFVGLSFFYSKPWCNVCPTGFFFDSCKKQSKSSDKKLFFNMNKSDILNLLLVAVIIIILLKGGGMNTNESETIPQETVGGLNDSKNQDTLHIKKSFGKRPIMYPMPALVIGSFDEKGQPNIMTAAWGGIVNSSPLSIGVSLRPATQTYKNIMKTGAFTVNYASEQYTAYVDWVGEHSGRDVNKFEALGLTPVTSSLVNAPYVKEFPVIVECKVIQTQKLGRHTQFIGEVIDVKVDEGCLSGNDEIDISKVGPIIYGGSGYYGFGRYIGKPGKMHRQLNVNIKGE